MQVSSVKRIRTIGKVWIFSFALVFGLILLIFVGRSIVQGIPENCVKTEATITEIEEVLSPSYVSGDDTDFIEYEYHVLIEYSYDGEHYSNMEYGSYNSSMKKGDQVTIYLDPNDPEEFIGDPSDNYPFLLICIAVVLIGAGGLASCINKKEKEK